MLCVHYLPFSFEQIFMIIQGQTENLCVGLIIILCFLQVKLIKKLMLTSWKQNAIPSGMMALLHQLLFQWGVICMQQMLGIRVLQFQWLAKVNISLQNLANVHFSSGEFTQFFVSLCYQSLFGHLMSFSSFCSHLLKTLCQQNFIPKLKCKTYYSEVGKDDISIKSYFFLQLFQSWASVSYRTLRNN